MHRTKAEPLFDVEIQVLMDTFPDLSWIEPEDWQSIAAYHDWRSWLDDWDLKEIPGLILSCFTGLREQRIAIRRDCRAYFGEEHVPNIHQNPGMITIPDEK